MLFVPGKTWPISKSVAYIHGMSESGYSPGREKAWSITLKWYIFLSISAIVSALICDVV